MSPEAKRSWEGWVLIHTMSSAFSDPGLQYNSGLGLAAMYDYSATPYRVYSLDPPTCSIIRNRILHNNDYK